MQILTFICKQNVLEKQKRNIREHMSCRVCIKRSLNLAEIICNNLLPLCNWDTLVYDLRNVPDTFAQIIEVSIISKKAECDKHADCMAQCKLCW